MSALHTPTLAATSLPEVAALPQSDRDLIHALVRSPSSLAAIAERFNSDVVALTQRLLSPACQAALRAIENLSEQVARLRSFSGSTAALEALAELSEPINPSLTERRRAAAAILRAAPVRPPRVPPTGRSEPARAITPDRPGVEASPGTPQAQTREPAPAAKPADRPPIAHPVPARVPARVPAPGPAATLVGRAGAAPQPTLAIRVRDRPALRVA